MRQKRTVQATTFEVFSDHEVGRELQTMSEWLDVALRGAQAASSTEL